jgi:hypothetical protein
VAERRVDVLLVRWYERREGAAAVLPRWLAAAEEHLPAALPRRFGDTEPLRGRLDRVGPGGLASAYDRAEQIFLLDGVPPVRGATLAPARRPPWWGPVEAHTLHVELGGADEAVQRFATALAGEGTLYVSASVERDLLLDGRTLVYDRSSTGEPFLAPLGDWLGLPPAPPTWCWFGPLYGPLIRHHLDAEPVGGGLLRTSGPWVPADLVARLDEVDPARRRAARIPRGSRRSLWRVLTGGRARRTGS